MYSRTKADYLFPYHPLEIWITCTEIPFLAYISINGLIILPVQINRIDINLFYKSDKPLYKHIVFLLYTILINPVLAGKASAMTSDYYNFTFPYIVINTKLSNSPSLRVGV
jgi:hypothetical protein